MSSNILKKVENNFAIFNSEKALNFNVTLEISTCF